MIPSVADFQAFFPGLCADSARVQLFLDLAVAQVPEHVWGVSTKAARLYLAGHMLTMADRAAKGISGAVTQSRVGDLSRSYAAPSSGGSEELKQTAFGLEFLRLRRTVAITPMVTGC